MFEHYLNIFITTVFIENIALSVFLGMCTFIAISKKIDAAIGLGIAVIVVCLITVPLNNIIYNFILRDGALAWAGLPNTNLEFVELVASEQKSTFASTGMCTIEQIDTLVDIFSKHECPLVLMHTNSEYPSREKNLNLKSPLSHISMEFHLMILKIKISLMILNLVEMQNL